MKDFMLNELSIEKVGSVQEAKETIEKFILATVKANRFGFESLRIFENSKTLLYSLSLYSNYSINEWLKDQSVNFDLKEKFKQILTSSPLIRDEEITEFKQFHRSEFSYNRNDDLLKAYGLGASYVYETLCLSFSTDDCWKNSEIEVVHYEIDEDGDNSASSIRNICHFFDEESLIGHSSWIQNLQLQALQKNKNLWENRVTIYPNLIFCLEVEAQLLKLGSSKLLTQIFERLHSLNTYAEHWKDGDFDYLHLNTTTNLRVSPDSDSTLRQFGASRNFKLPGGEKVVFSLHIKTGILRLYFYAENTTKNIYIGYIGTHLRISSEN